MRSSYPYRWAEVILEQMLIARQITGVLARSVDLERLPLPQAKADNCENQAKDRLNPLEFHGRRHSPAPKCSRAGHPEHSAGLRRLNDRRAR